MKIFSDSRIGEEEVKIWTEKKKKKKKKHARENTRINR